MNKSGKGGFQDNPENINKNGRGIGSVSIPDMLRRIGKEKEGELDNFEIALRKVYELAKSGTRWAVEFIANYTTGRPVQTIIMPERQLDEIVEIGGGGEVKRFNHETGEYETYENEQEYLDVIEIG